MLLLLSTIVPVCGALYAAASSLLERRRAIWERATRLRIDVEYFHPLAETQSERSDRYEYGSPARQREQTRARDLRNTLLAAHGLSTEPASYTGMAVDAAMSVSISSPADVRRQWVLILSATAGVVLLGLSQLGDVTP